jgi:hypothetical protein
MKRGLELAFLIAGLLAAGCSSSSSGNPDGVAEAFMGRWDIEGTSSSFSLACPATFQSALNIPVWTELDFDHGVLSDLVDVSTACSSPGIGFDVDKSGVTAQAVNPDPFTGVAPLCRLVVGTDTNGLPIFIDFSFSSLTITKLAASGTDKAPRVLYGGQASGPLMQDDGTNTGTNVQIDTCTYSGPGDSFHRTTQP